MYRKMMSCLISVLLLVVLSACSRGIASTGSSHNLIISHFLPGNHPIQTQVFQQIGNDWKQKSNGEITFELYPSNALGNAGSQYDMAVTGEADIALSVHGYSPGRFPLVSVMELPFLAESAAHGSEIIANLYEEFPSIQAEHDDTIPLYLFTAEPAQLIMKDHQIESPDDLKGLRVRSPSPLANDILEALGAVPISMPMGDVYESLERGVIDGAMVPLEALYNYNLHEIASYITIGNFSATPFFTVMNKDTYQRFTDSEKELINESTDINTAIKSGRVFDVDGQKGRKLAVENGAKVIELSEQQLVPWRQALNSLVQSWIEEMESKGLPGEKIYQRAKALKDEVK
ncbi:TRAP transporter substrate-binding protein [Virgibacillus salexigens]|uniref:TRAP transporter substrate-binding protein n=1 Tax=Virgibacillus salexigens TaxID=61016 RepID=UPI00190D43B9|nr:TRAP transporter substrate-binding protein [Virgibacillus salexigens]